MLAESEMATEAMSTTTRGLAGHWPPHPPAQWAAWVNEAVTATERGSEG